jgi:hypothetical protein
VHHHLPDYSNIKILPLAIAARQSGLPRKIVFPRYLNL